MTDLAQAAFTPEQAAALKTLANYGLRKAPEAFVKTAAVPYVDPVDWAQRNYYVIDPLTDQPGLIRVARHHKGILRFALDPAHQIQTFVFSSIKKSGKSAIGGLAGRYLAENSGNRAEVYFVANDKEQARGRGYQSVLSSLELNPLFNRPRNELPGKWKVIQLHAIHLPTNSAVKAIANDYAGEAGANPVASVWTEIWGLKTESSKRLWSEMTPVLTRARSMRIVETYAGYQDESDILLDLFTTGKAGRRMEPEEIDWPFDDAPPVWYNEDAGVFMYWDEGVEARRMPWQRGQRAEKYYSTERISLGDVEFERLHMNKWQVSTNPFIPDVWWDRQATEFPPIDKHEPLVLALDGSLTDDSTGLVGVTRHPDRVGHPREVAVRFTKEWVPTGRKASGLASINFAEIKEQLGLLNERCNVVVLVYDEYQLAQMAQELTLEAILWAKKFSQSGLREIADKKLYDLIRDRKIWHTGQLDLAQHVKNAAAKAELLDNDKHQKIRIVKKSKHAKVDLCVALSMAAYECLRLLLD